MAVWPYNTTRWQRLRARKLEAQPLCAPCHLRGIVRAADTVDHKISIKAGGEPFPDLDGLTSMCASCHGRKTSEHDRPDRRPGPGLMRGCDVDGRPRGGVADARLTSNPGPMRANKTELVGKGR